ncbi:NAPE-hydrolyzing phospholipase D [Xylaria palmicola]|nr:NAPE-hydrolyzing phospholipase D [Xylaria palmicola]
MHFLRSLWQSSSRRTPSVARYSKLASAGTKTTAVAMTAYVCTVAAQPVSDEALSEKHAKDHHVKNSRGETIKFQNPHPSHIFPALSVFVPAIIKTMFSPSEAPKPKLADKLVPVVKPQFLATRTASPRLRATWLGHACYYVEYPSGLRVLFDPVFEDCCTPVSLSGFRRYTERPCDIGDIPFVDAVVISHSHYDHLSYPSVREVQRHHPGAHFFVGLGLEKWFRASGVDQVTEMDWWDEAEVTFTPQQQAAGGDAPPPPPPIKATISCLPSQHSSGRTGFDRDHTLWASWGIRSGEKTVWFGGDTGYRTVPKVAEGLDDWAPELQHLPVCPQFRQIGEHLGSVDLGLIPIGAYSPRHIFSHMHANPFDSVEIFRDTRCKRAMGIHWGTWVLTREHPLEPPRLLREALKRRGLPETGVFDVCDIGESREF